MTDTLLWALYMLPLAVVVVIFGWLRRKREGRDTRIWRQAVEWGLAEPRSLHPVVDQALCMGAGACIKACPEDALGFVNDKATLINPSACIGHGTCATACPVEAIKLVFGSADRGVEIPYVKSTLESNVPGIFIAGELAGKGLIHKAAEQGWQAVESIRRLRGKGSELDLVIVGAGPAGLTAALAATQHKLRFLMLEQEPSLGGTVYHYPRHKIVLVQPVNLPLVPQLRSGEISKEELLAFWQGIVDRVGLPVQYGQRVERIVAREDGFEVVTQLSCYRPKSVLLALGLSGTPRKLGVPGEHLPKVVYRLIDAEQYEGKHVLVVGGGDSALEAALSVAHQPRTTVTLSCRGRAFGGARQKNRHRIEEAAQARRLTLAMQTHVLRIADTTVTLKGEGDSFTLKNDAVIVCAGGVLPTAILRDVGVTIETKFGST